MAIAVRIFMWQTLVIGHSILLSPFFSCPLWACSLKPISDRSIRLTNQSGLFFPTMFSLMSLIFLELCKKKKKCFVHLDRRLSVLFFAHLESFGRNVISVAEREIHAYTMPMFHSFYRSLRDQRHLLAYFNRIWWELIVEN